jgi:hypothetical protein
MFKSNSSWLESVWCELFKFKYEFDSVMINGGQFALNYLLLCLIAYC